MTKQKIFFSALVVLILCSALLWLSCHKKIKEQPVLPTEEASPVPMEKGKAEEAPVEVEETWTAAPQQDEVPEVTSIDELNKQKVLKIVYFDFDKYNLRDDTISILKENAQWLLDHVEYNVLLKGHCDERGTIEYNLELGAKRANAVISYIINLGLDAERLKMISYGEERPADPGHHEEAWAKNRRVEFILEE